jgi:hypothetical protein
MHPHGFCVLFKYICRGQTRNNSDELNTTWFWCALIVRLISYVCVTNGYLTVPLLVLSLQLYDAWQWWRTLIMMQIVVGEYYNDVKSLVRNIVTMWNRWRGTLWRCEIVGGEHCNNVKSLVGNIVTMWNCWRGILWGCEIVGEEHYDDVKSLVRNIVTMWNRRRGTL